MHALCVNARFCCFYIVHYWLLFQIYRTDFSTEKQIPCYRYSVMQKGIDVKLWRLNPDWNTPFRKKLYPWMDLPYGSSAEIKNSDSFIRIYGTFTLNMASIVIRKSKWTYFHHPYHQKNWKPPPAASLYLNPPVQHAPAQHPLSQEAAAVRQNNIFPGLKPWENSSRKSAIITERHF